MRKQRISGILAAAIVVCGSVVYGYWRWGGSQNSSRGEILALMPAEASAVLFIDLDALRQSPFLAELYKWAPQTRVDPDYAQFLKSTGFNYESDLSCASIAVLKSGQASTLFVVAQGRFDKRKISGYALQSGTRASRDGREIFSVPLGEEKRQLTFTFLRNDRIALTDGTDLEPFLAPPKSDSDAPAWRERFRRLAGSPIFAVVRQDAAAGTAFDAQAPGGLRSPQLSALINQLEWITVAGKPEDDRLRVVLEGEGAPDAPTRQLSDLINGLLVLAQAGLSDPKMRQELQPDAREAYSEMLKSADVSQIDRGETKSVRLMFDLTPKFLAAARAAMPVMPAQPQSKAVPHKSAIRN